MGGRGAGSGRKQLTNAQVASKLGGNLWEKGGHERVYFPQEKKQSILGLDIDRYGTGNIRKATLNGEKISNSQAGRILSSVNNAYYDIKSKTFNYRETGREEIDSHVNKSFKKYIKSQLR